MSQKTFVPLLIAIVFALNLPAISLSSNKVDVININEAYSAGLISLTMSAQKDVKTIKLGVTKTLSVPLIILISKGTTKITDWPGLSFYSDKEIKLNLTDTKEESVILKLIGSTLTGNLVFSKTVSFGPKTISAIDKMKYARELIIEEFINNLKDNDSSRREEAAEILGEIGYKKAIQPLKDLIEKESNILTRKAAEKALGKIIKSSQ